MNKPLTVAEAKRLQRGTWVWFEEAWMSKPCQVKVTDNLAGGIVFGNVWRAYERYEWVHDGWRLWAEQPTQTERNQAKWNGETAQTVPTGRRQKAR